MSEIAGVTRPSVVVCARVARNEPGALEAQVSMLRELAARHGWTNPTVICETRALGMSDEARRAVLRCDVLVIRDYSRLSRQVHRMLQFGEAVRASGMRLITPDSIGGPGEGSEPVELLVKLQALIVESERAGHSERTRRGIAAAKARREAAR